MDERTVKRVDSVYRNIRQMPLLSALGIFVPIVGIVLLPVAIGYSFFLSSLLRQYRNQEIQFGAEAHFSQRDGEPSTEQKLVFLQRNGRRHLLFPFIVGSGWILFIIGIMFLIIILEMNRAS